MATKNTVEEHILKLLIEKIQLFERVVGELDHILTNLDIGNIEEHIRDIIATSRSDGEIKIKMENLSSIVNYGYQMKQQDA